MRASVAWAAAVLSAAGIAACGGSGTTVSGSFNSGPGPSATATGTGTTATATETSTSTTSTSTAAAAPACVAADLSVSFESSNGAAGNTAAYFELKNTSSHPCHTYGFPGVLFLDHTGAPLPTDATRSLHDLIGPNKEVGFTLAPGAVASFHVIVGLSATGAGCHTADGLQVIAPDDTATMRTTIPNGLYECGTATLSPLAPGNGIPPGT